MPQQSPDFIFSIWAEMWTTIIVFGWWIAEIITMLTNEKRRAIHDYIAGTVVVRTNIEA